MYAIGLPPPPQGADSTGDLLERCVEISNGSGSDMQFITVLSQYLQERKERNLHLNEPFTCNLLVFKWVNDLNGHFSNEDTQMVNKYMKKSVQDFNHRRNGNKTFAEVSFTLSRMAITKKCWQGYFGKKNQYRLLVGV